MSAFKRIVSVFLCFEVLLFSISFNFVAYASGPSMYGVETLWNWITGNSSEPLGGWNPVTYLDKLFSSNQPQKYYTTPTSSVQDKSGNVTNYYRGGDTTNTQIIDSYNKTFNTIWNTNNTTNNYKANVKLENFLNQYTTNNVTNNNTYTANFKSWYYDNTTNNYNYTTNNLYYNQDNSQYYISIDNSTDEYYLIDVQYSPTFVTVNYTYNTTNINNEQVGDVTNVYYFELKDGRNSSTLTSVEVSGIDINYNAANYDLVTDDPNTLSLQHFDGDYTDSSSFNRTFYSENRSNQYVDSGSFGQAVKLSSGSAAGVTIPNLSSYDSLTFDFRVYYADISNLGIYFGDTNIFREIPSYRRWSGVDIYTDDGLKFISSAPYGSYDIAGGIYTSSQIGYSGSVSSATTVVSGMTVPTSYSSSGYTQYTYATKRYGWFSTSGAPTLYDSTRLLGWQNNGWGYYNGDYLTQRYQFTYLNRSNNEYRWTPPQSVWANFSYSNYKNQWVSMRITLSGGNLYYFVNGDLVGSGSFTKPAADKFYIKSSGTVYLDELRVTTGSLSSTSTYNPSSSPYDTNKVLALPDVLSDNTIYVQNNTTITNLRVGGVRPSNPGIGFLYIPLYDDRTAAQPQLYDGSNWIDVTAMVHVGDITVNVLGYKFSPVGDSPDVDINVKPGRPTKPGENVDQDTCTHEWEVTGGTKSTCTLPGSVESTCSKCQKTKTETLPKLGHTWEIKQSIQTTYDENGNVVTQGFTIYRCSVCGEEYKDTDGSGPPSGSSGSGDEGEEKEGFLSWLLRKAGELLGAVGKGVISFLQGVLDQLFDGLIGLINSVFENLTKLLDLFGSFGDALSVLWTWLPPEIVAVLVAGVSVFVLVALLKLVMK